LHQLPSKFGESTTTVDANGHTVNKAGVDTSMFTLVGDFTDEEGGGDNPGTEGLRSTVIVGVAIGL
jgi:hypothetical protein